MWTDSIKIYYTKSQENRSNWGEGGGLSADRWKEVKKKTEAFRP
jgi:hypothetical protein